MADDTNLELDIDHEGNTPIVRVVVGTAQAYSRHSGAPIISANCGTSRELEQEIARLQDELGVALTRAKEAFGEASELPPARTQEGRKETAAAKLNTTLLVGDVMTKDVWTINPNDKLSLVTELMKQGRFRHIVVMNDDQAIEGVISHRDVFHGALAWSLGQGEKGFSRVLEATPAKDVMHADVVTVDPKAPLADAAALMRKHKIGCLPVMDGNTLAGILTEGDFLALLV